MRFALLAIVSVTLFAPAHAGKGAFLIPPLEFDVGVGAPVGSGVETLSPSTEILAGIHWASLAWKPTRFDVGVGYVGSFREIDRSRINPDELSMHGVYLSLGTRIAGGDHWRTWFSARGELMHAFDWGRNREFGVAGGALRVSTELFAQTFADRRGGAAVGTVALGLYVEATYRDVPAELGPVGFTSGISCRLPFLFVTGN